METPEDIFVAVRQLPVAEREVYLEENCQSPEQRSAVDALLKAAELGDGYFAEIDSAVPEIAEKPGDTIGSYKLLQQIGEGGFGVVFMAEQREPINRRVALKIIKPGMDTREVIARFEAERQAIAMMDHPNIAKVLDAGSTDRGRPYFVMELVKGIPLTTFCDEQKLRTRQRLELFGEICSAVNHAHQKGIIHRDLKPSNILVTLHGDKAVPKIIDFGIAKATQQQLTDKTLFTRFEQFVGTPVYMSPEQAALSGLDIDTRSDIYSLGVLLYELLAGKPPFDSKTLRSAGYDEMRRIIREEEPPKPSTRIACLAGEERASLGAARQGDPNKLSGQLRGELDWIVMKAIEKDRSRRYETANGFALDIRRHLSGDSVSAAAPSAAYKFRKFAHRHKAQLAVGSAVAIALVSGALITTRQAFRAEREAHRKTQALAQLRAAAPAFLSQAEDLVHLGRPAEAVNKIGAALALQPENAGFLLRKAQLLQAQLRLQEASDIYRVLLEIEPDHTAARRDLALCTEVLRIERNERGGFSTQALAALRQGMLDARRPASELAVASAQFENEAAQLKEFWLERLRDLPVDQQRPLDGRLYVESESGRFALTLAHTEVTDLSPLMGMPLGALVLNDCRSVVDLSPLAGLPLRTLILSDTSVRDLSALGNIATLVSLNLDRTGVSDLSPLEGLALEELSLRDCGGIRDLEPLRGMPIAQIDLCSTSVSSFAPLEGMPLHYLHACGVPAGDVDHLSELSLGELIMNRHKVSDLGFVENMPLTMLSITGCWEARNFRALTAVSTLQNISLPSDLESLPPEEQRALDTLFDERSSVRQVTDWKVSGDSYAATERKESFARRWHSLRRLGKILSREGIDYALSREDKTSYNLHIRTPAFDDLSLLKEARLEGVRLHNLNVHDTQVSDLSPLRGMQIEEIVAYNTGVDDLKPLREMHSLTRLEVANSPVDDITPLRGLSLETLTIDGTGVTDVSPLAGMNSLRSIMLPVAVTDFEPLRNLPLEWVSFWWDFASNRPIQSADEFWHLDPGEFFETRESLKALDWNASQDYFTGRASRTLHQRELDAESALELLQAATVLALGSNPQPYHELCEQILALHVNSEDPATLERSSKAVLLMESSDPALMDQAVEMMREAYRIAEGNSPWFHLGRALAEYRAGDPGASIRLLEKINRDDPRIAAAALALEALANERNGHPQAAQLALEEAVRETAKLMGEFPQRVEHNGGWHDALICQMLTDEAARLIETVAGEDEKPKGSQR